MRQLPWAWMDQWEHTSIFHKRTLRNNWWISVGIFLDKCKGWFKVMPFQNQASLQLQLLEMESSITFPGGMIPACPNLTGLMSLRWRSLVLVHWLVTPERIRNAILSINLPAHSLFYLYRTPDFTVTLLEYSLGAGHVVSRFCGMSFMVWTHANIF